MLFNHPQAAAQRSACHASDQLMTFLCQRLPLPSLEASGPKILRGSRAKIINWSCKSSSKLSASCMERTALVSSGQLVVVFSRLLT